MRRIVFLLLLSLSLANGAKAQLFYTWTEYGVMLGGAHYFGDLNDNYGFRYPQPMAGAFIRLHLNPYIAVRGSLSGTRIGYDDAWSNNAYNKKRNLSFRSDIVEAVASAEFNFFRFSTGEEKSRFTPYLTGGVGAVYFNPYTTYNGVKYNLRDLHTEGPGHSYGSVAAVIPVGAGIKYWLRPGCNFGFEITNRFTTTDYLDDVSTTYAGANKFTPGTPAYILQDRSVELDAGSPIGTAGKQRGNSTSKDQYIYVNFTLSFQFKTYKCPSYQTQNYDFVP